MKCKLPFTKDGADLVKCHINNYDGNCKICGCPTVAHMHATIEYFSVEQETVAFSTLAESIASMDVNIGGEKAKINTYEI